MPPKSPSLPNRTSGSSQSPQALTSQLVHTVPSARTDNSQHPSSLSWALSPPGSLLGSPETGLCWALPGLGASPSELLSRPSILPVSSPELHRAVPREDRHSAFSWTFACSHTHFCSPQAHHGTVCPCTCVCVSVGGVCLEATLCGVAKPERGSVLSQTV